MKHTPAQSPSQKKLTHRRGQGIFGCCIIAALIGALSVLAFFCFNRIQLIAERGEIAMYPYFFPACLIVGIGSVALMLVFLVLNVIMLRRYSGHTPKGFILFTELLLAFVSAELSYYPIAFAMIIAM